jgi:hypothetical protein
MSTKLYTEELQENVKKKYHLYVQVSTRFHMMGKGPHRLSLYEQVTQASREWKLAQQQLLLHLRHLENSRMKIYS